MILRSEGSIALEFMTCRFYHQHTQDGTALSGRRHRLGHVIQLALTK